MLDDNVIRMSNEFVESAVSLQLYASLARPHLRDGDDEINEEATLPENHSLRLVVFIFMFG